MIFCWVQLRHPGGASAEWGSSCWKFLPVVMEVPTLSPPLSGDLQVEILIQILIIQVCNPRKYEAIVTVNWWILDYEGCSILKISWVRAVFLIVPDVVTRHNRSVKNELRCWNKKSWLSFSSFVALRRAAAWRPKLFEFVEDSMMWCDASLHFPKSRTAEAQMYSHIFI